MRALIVTLPITLLLACSHDFGFLDTPPVADASSSDDGSTDATTAVDGEVVADGAAVDAGADAGVDAAIDAAAVDAAPHDAASKDATPDVAPRDAAPDVAVMDSGTTYTVCGNKSVKGCNPMTNAGCDSSSHCVWQNTGVFECVADNGNKTWPSVCADLTECATGFDCFPTSGNNLSQCVKYCCADSDCPGTAPTCGSFDQVGTCR